MPIRKTFVLKNGRRKDVTALRAEEFVKWANQQTSHKLSRVDEDLIVRQRISGWLCFIWGTPKILRSIGFTNRSLAMLLYVNSRLIGLRNDEVIEDDKCRCCYCEIKYPGYEDYEDYHDYDNYDNYDHYADYDDYESYPLHGTSAHASPYGTPSPSGQSSRLSAFLEHLDEDDA